MAHRLSIGIAVVLGLGALANGVYMMVAPESWYWLVPGVPDRGPFNQHFVRDIGFTYALIGCAFICGAIYARQRLLLWSMSTAWLVSHGVFHIWEVIVGICGPASLAEDFGGVTLPALLGVGLVIYCSKHRNGA